LCMCSSDETQGTYSYMGQPISASVRPGLVSVSGACARTGSEVESNGGEDVCAEPGSSQVAEEQGHPSGIGYACYG
jgi:hypothetical protein